MPKKTHAIKALERWVGSALAKLKEHVHKSPQESRVRRTNRCQSRYHRFGVRDRKERREVAKASLFFNLISASHTDDDTGSHRSYRSMTASQRVDVFQIAVKHAPPSMMVPPNTLGVGIWDPRADKEAKVIWYETGCLLRGIMDNLHNIQDGYKIVKVIALKCNMRESPEYEFERSRILEYAAALQEVGRWSVTTSANDTDDILDKLIEPTQARFLWKASSETMLSNIST